MCNNNIDVPEACLCKFGRCFVTLGQVVRIDFVFCTSTKVGYHDKENHEWDFILSEESRCFWQKFFAVMIF